MPKGERLATPTSCRISDLLNGMMQFTTDNADWLDDEDSLKRMAFARQMVTDIAHPLEVTDDEYAFVETLTHLINQKVEENG